MERQGGPARTACPAAQARDSCNAQRSTHSTHVATGAWPPQSVAWTDCHGALSTHTCTLPSTVDALTPRLPDGAAAERAGAGESPCGATVCRLLCVRR